MPELMVRNDRDEGRYVVEVDGRPAGFAVYHMRGGRHFFVHTEIDPEFGGRGVGSELARQALDDVRSHGGKIIPLCPFIRGFVERRPEYEDLVDQELWSRIERRLEASGDSPN